MAKITDMKVPGVGTVNILSPRDWIAIIGGVLVLIIAVAAGQNAARALSRRVPAVDTTIEPLTTAPAVVTKERVEVI